MSWPCEIANFTEDKSLLYEKRLLSWFFSLIWFTLAEVELMKWQLLTILLVRWCKFFFFSVYANVYIESLCI